VTGYLIG